MPLGFSPIGIHRSIGTINTSITGPMSDCASRRSLTALPTAAIRAAIVKYAIRKNSPHHRSSSIEMRSAIANAASPAIARPPYVNRITTETSARPRILPQRSSSGPTALSTTSMTLFDFSSIVEVSR